MTRLDFVKARLLAAPPTGASALAYNGLAVALPTIVRASIDNVVSGTTFVAYYPFVLLSALFLGWRNAVWVTVASAVVANFLFMVPRYSFFHAFTDTFGAVLFIISSALIIGVADTLRRTLQDAHGARLREAHLNRELQHRVKNTLAVVQGLATQTFRDLPDAKSQLSIFQGRILALAEANEILRHGHWETCQLPELALRALEPFNSAGAIGLVGPACSLQEATCVPLVLALHELATNAVKYGALSTPQGLVEVHWAFEDNEQCDGSLLTLEWVECGGPQVDPPTRRGLGSRLLRPQPGLIDVTLQFASEGVRCQIVVDRAAHPTETIPAFGRPPTVYSTGGPSIA